MSLANHANLQTAVFTLIAHLKTSVFNCNVAAATIDNKLPFLLLIISTRVDGDDNEDDSNNDTAIDIDS
jgi:hypothetical protein